MTQIVGWLGLGKLGLPCALTLAHDADIHIAGYDPDPNIADVLAGDLSLRNQEAGLVELLADTHRRVFEYPDIASVVAETSGLIMCAVQTPHAPLYGGERPMPDTRADFDYTVLQEVAAAVNAAATEQQKHVTLVVISTALPGTMRRVVVPEISDGWVTLLYSPHFIAMGTTIRDYRQPEFVLIGADNPNDATQLTDLYAKVHSAPVHVMSMESAELAKVAYNTVISTKIVFANTLMEICDRTGADVDAVTGALKAATDRVVSPAYMDAGMGDGGACHPRDLIAMSWLAEQHGLSTDIFTYLVEAREAQTKWLAGKVIHEAENRGLPIVLLGKAYKPGSDLQYGSPALLLAHYLTEAGVSFEHYDHYCGDTIPHGGWGKPTLFVIATRHPDYQNEFSFPDGSAVIDLFRYVEDNDGDVEFIRLGAGWEEEA